MSDYEILSIVLQVILILVTLIVVIIKAKK